MYGSQRMERSKMSSRSLRLTPRASFVGSVKAKRNLVAESAMTSKDQFHL